MTRQLVGAALLCLIFSPALAEMPEAEPLWPRGAPAATGDGEADTPTLRHYPAETPRPSGAAVIVCPGGGYGVLAYDHEGHQVARFLARQGVAAFVLRYRHSPYRHPIPLQDAQRAIRHVRHHAESLRVDPQRIGIMGFSAGGHLASTAATHFDDGDPQAADPVDRQGCRPDFAVLCYPVISMTAPWGHGGSRRNLLGERAEDEQLARSLSNELQVGERTPRTFLFHTAEDRGVPVENSLAFFRALREHDVPAELHVYQHGPHGVGLGSGDPVLSTWPQRLIEWMRSSNLLAAVPRAAAEGDVSIGGKPVRWGTILIEPAGEAAGWRPSGWAMVRGGKFSMTAATGPPVGKCRVRVTDWGGVVPRPTIDDAATYPAGELEVRAGKNLFSVAVERAGE